MILRLDKYPLWLKVIFIILSAVLIFSAVKYLNLDLFKRNVGPEEAPQIAREIIEIDKVLPGSWRYLMASSDNQDKMVAFVNDDKKVNLVITKFLNKNDKSARELANMPPDFDPKIPWKEAEDNLIVGGQNGWYIRYRFGDEVGERIYVDLPDHRHILIEIFPTKQKSNKVDLAASREILQCIKNFRSD